MLPQAYDFEDFFENTLHGFVVADADSVIERANRCLTEWIGESVAGRPFPELLTIGGKIYYQTNLAPLLRMQGHFDEVALELASASGKKIPVLVSAMERRDDDGNALFIRFTVLKASDRRQYERNLLEARAAAVNANAELRDRIAAEVRERLVAERNLSAEQHTTALREQFIAVLGHDLRNPLASIAAGIRALEKTPLNERALTYTHLIQGSVTRMARLISDVMDFARGRLGGGFSISRESTDLSAELTHVVSELKIAWPDRKIEAHLDMPAKVNCDPGRVSQLVSNLLANAITHGAPDGPVRLIAKAEPDWIEIAVTNTGRAIPAAVIERLFLPFTRDEMRPSQQGLGLGLYIASEIARAHGGTLVASSTEAQTVFTFRLPVTD